MRLLDPRKIDVAFKADNLQEWDMAEGILGWHRIATTEQYKLGMIQGRVIMLIHPSVELKRLTPAEAYARGVQGSLEAKREGPSTETVKEYIEEGEKLKANIKRGRRK